MMNKKSLKRYFSITSLLFLCYSAATPAFSMAANYTTINLSVLDSIRQEIVGNIRFVIHQLEPKETYYQLSRIYGVPVDEIMVANNKKSLRIGDTVRIPRGKAVANHATAHPTPAPAANHETAPSTQEVFTEYKVGKSETLFAISRRFDITVETIKQANNLNSDNLREGQILKIPAKNIPQVQPTLPLEDNPLVIIDENQPLDLSDFEANRYGIREKKERGIGVWMDSLGDGESLALHKTAPIGTILKITNPMNNSVTFAKVVGKFADNHETQNAIVVISKSVAKTIGLLDRRFQVELHYGAPL